jgi:perosamine synthetase
MHNIKIPVYKPSLNGNELKYVTQCIASGWISSKGAFVEKFEHDFAEFINIPWSTAVCNGTVALHLALEALGVGFEDEVIVPTLTYIASANAITYTCAKPVFVDSLKNTWQIDTDDVIRKITIKTKAIMCVHLYGHACEMDTLVEICNKYNLFLIEDCAEAIGTYYKGRHVGTFGDVATFSFYGNKTITTGEGGMVLTSNKTLYERLVHLKGQGLAKYREYWHDTIGYNYRMTNICAAIGVAQLEKIGKILKEKRKIAILYKKYLVDSDFSLHEEMENTIHSYWMCTVLIKNPAKRDELRNFLLKEGVETRPIFYPIHTMPMYSSKFEKHPIAEDISRRGINLPSFPDLDEESIGYITNLMKKFME